MISVLLPFSLFFFGGGGVGGWVGVVTIMTKNILVYSINFYPPTGFYPILSQGNFTSKGF